MVNAQVDTILDTNMNIINTLSISVILSRYDKHCECSGDNKDNKA